MTAPADRWGDRLPRRLGLWSAVAILVGSTIGGGIFRTPAIIAARVPSPWPMLGVWVLGGLLALCGALTYAELGALFPRSGGVFVYIREGFGRLPAFLFGWTELTLIRASALGAIATPFAEYLLRLLGYDPAQPGVADAVHYVAAGAIAVTATLNYVGVRWSALVLNASTAAKYGALVVLVLLAFVTARGNFAHFAAPAGTLSGGLFGLSLVSVLWAYDGWGDLSFVGGEVRDPERNLPRALILGTGAIILIYLLVNAAYLYLLPIEQMARSPLVAADAAQLLVGRTGVTRRASSSPWRTTGCSSAPWRACTHGFRRRRSRSSSPPASASRSSWRGRSSSWRTSSSWRSSRSTPSPPPRCSYCDVAAPTCHAPCGCGAIQPSPSSLSSPLS